MLKKIPFITCAICNRQVDKIEMERNIFSNSVVYRVECHGDTDRCEIDSQELLMIPIESYSSGVAFSTKKIV
jgi:hypothetical protein